MTMADEYDVSKIVTTFLLDTCRLPPRLTIHDVHAAALCAVQATAHPPDDKEVELIPLTTGSIAEFTIEPMLLHAGDIDIMYHRNTQLAIPRGHPPPTQLPAEFHSYVKVMEITDSHLPGYVYLMLRYLLTRCTDDGQYSSCRENDQRKCLSHGDDNGRIHGPAMYFERIDEHHLCLDKVHCVRCLSWPLQAADWPTRHRNYGWPDSATLDRVVSNGCDVVGVAHRQCRQHEWMGKNQWRLSFSRSEIVLINSWLPVQQIVYHMLRYFIKIGRLTDCTDNSDASTLSNYHIKTLMLWASELKARSWWTENVNLVRICVELLRTLSVWLTDTRCKHYFINNCNLLDNSFDVGSVASKLMSVDEEYLSTWFVNNYIGQCALLCPNYASRMFSNVSTSMDLENAVLEIIRWRQSTSLYDSWLAVDFAQNDIPGHVSLHSLTARSCVYWMNTFSNIDSRLSVYFSAVALLHVARKISRRGFSDELMTILSTALGRNSYFNKRRSVLSLCETELSTSQLVELLQKSAVEYLTAYRQLVARDFGSVVTIVTTEFEALYAYKRGDYQRCLQLSTQNVHTLLYAARMPYVPILTEFIQLLDDDIVSLTALTLIVNPECRDHIYGFCITQLTLSLYLMTQCQLKLRHSVTSLDYIKVAQTRHPHKLTMDHLTLKLTERKSY